MRYFKLIISLTVLIGVVYLLSNPLGSLPAIGNLVNPFTGFWQNADVKESGTFQLFDESLEAAVEIIYDDRHIPHIFAQNINDLIFAQGYAIARERLWQMDITTRAIEGKTSEILGAGTLQQDMKTRRRGLPRAAKLAAETWKQNEESYARLQRFCDGVNYYIASLDEGSYPLEFKLLGYEPQLWSPYRTALFVKAMAVTLNAGQIDVPSTNALNILGEENFYDLYPDRNKKQSPVINDVKWTAPLLELEDVEIGFENQIIRGKERSGHESFIGSNNFALSGARTKSGNPILANDPHLKLTLPSIWIEMHLVTPTMNVYGVSLPGMPGIILGFNEHISWGQTNVGQDVLDIYRVKWVDENKKQYFLDGKKENTEVVVETFQVKGETSRKDTILFTKWGPIMKENGQQTGLAQRWVSADAPPLGELDVYQNINKAKNYDDFRNALKEFATPAQNFIFSSNSGDIAMLVTGKFPIKSNQQGRFIQDGSTTETAWQGFIPFEELPQQLNPERNFVASANQHSVGESFPYYYNGGFEDYRGRYINSKLSNMKSATPSDLMTLQLDAYSLKAEEALPVLLENIDRENLSKKEKEVVSALEGWDYVYGSESLAASYFEEWWSAFYRRTFDEIYAYRDSIDMPLPEAFRLIELMEEDRTHWIFDQKETDEVEEMRNIVTLSFRQLALDTSEVLPWGEKRNTTIDHLTNIPAFGKVDIVSGGQGSTPNAIGRHTGPSWRMVVAMDEKVKGFGVYPGGQSGNPGSPYFDNFVDDWASGQYYELNNSPVKSAIEAVKSITLSPKK